jgi:hypothetical protein
MNTLSETLEGLRTAMITADRAMLEKLTADELSYGHTRGAVENKNEFIDAIVSRKDVFHTLEFSDQSMSVVENVAVVRHRFQADVTISGDRVQSDVRVLLVFIMRAERWQLLARQAFKVT